MTALEPRWVFDGALAPEVQALSEGRSEVDGVSIFQRTSTTLPPQALAEAQKEAQRQISQWMQQDDAARKLALLFGGGELNGPSLERAQALVDSYARGELAVRLELRSGADLMGLWGAFAQQGPDGQPVIYINADWLAAGATDAAQVTRVLAEEWGHFLDASLNGAKDSAGDEGEAFAAQLLGLSLTQQDVDRIAIENDHLRLFIDGVEVELEMASLLFSGQSYFAGLSALTGPVGTDPAGQTANLESNVLVIGNPLPGTRTVFVSDPPDAAYYSGNNVRGTLYAINADNTIANKYYGEISRLIKIGSAPVSAQMYIYPTSDPAVTSNPATTIIIDFYGTAPNFKTGDIAKTSSDPVASALNSLLPVNAAPTANADTATVLEAGGLNNTTPGTNPEGNVISGSDTDPNTTYRLDLAANKLVTEQDKLWVTQVTNGSGLTTAITTGSTSTSGGATVAGLYGTLTLGADGSYSYVVNNSLAAVQALRGTSNTLAEKFTYTITDGKGGNSTTTLTLTIQGANDTPVARDDYNVAKESIEPTSTTQYTTTDKIGATATGNVLPNDTDVDDYGETKTIDSLIATATGQTNGATVLNFGSSVPASVKVGFYVFTANSGTSPLLDGNGNHVTVSSISGGNVTLSGDAKLSGGGTLYFSSSNTSITSNGGSGTYAASAPSTGTSTAVSLTTDGYIAKGMTVSGAGVTSGTTVSSVTYDASGNVTGVVLSQAATIPAGTTLSFTAAPGTTLTGQYGTLRLNADGTYLYTPFANNPALNTGDQVVDEFRYRMKDATGATSDATLYITVLGAGPSDPDATADTANATEAGGTGNTTGGAAATGNLITNDLLGAGGISLSVVGAKSDQVGTVTNLSAGSVTLDSVSYDAAVVGQYGTLYLKADGSYRYVVNDSAATVEALKTGTSLSETFQYKLSNGAGFDWSTLTVSVGGAYDRPTAVNDGNVAIVGQYVPVGNVLANDTDVDTADTQTVTRVSAGSTLTSPSTVTAGSTATSTTPSYTTVTGTYGTLQIGADGSYTYLVNENHAAIIALGTGQRLASPDTFTYEVTDAGGLVHTAILTMNVEGRNDAPVNTLLTGPVTVQEGSTYAFNASGVGTVSASDPDVTSATGALASVTISVNYGTLSMTQTGSTGTAETQVITFAGGAVAYGSETGSPNGTSSITLYGTQAEINAALATLVYTPNAGFAGNDTLTIQSIDGEALRDVDTVTLDVNAPTLAVAGSSVNEASPYTVFTVSGKEGQWVSLALASTGTSAGSATLGTDTSLALEYFNGTDWVPYNSTANGGYVAIPTLPAGSGGTSATGETATLLVRVANTPDTANEGAETLKLVATNVEGAAAEGTSTIKDDGTGSIFLGNNLTATPNVAGDADPNGPDYPAKLDDDRPLTVSSVTVNEASPYAQFTVTGVAGQTVLLSLASLGTASPDPTGGAASLTAPALEYYNGTSWVAYDAANPPVIAVGQTTLMVRVGISTEAETALDGPETFALVATNTGGTAGTGAATIVDDGSGDYYAYNPNGLVAAPLSAPAASALDDDRLLSVNSIEVNEASPYATFTVTGEPGQYVSLALGNTVGTGDTDASLGTDTANPTNATSTTADDVALQYFNGTSWVDYTPGSFVQVPTTGTTLLVRTAIAPDASPEGAETFTLVATNTGNTPATGTATIKDDGTGDIFKYSSNTTSTPLPPSDAGYPALDDDRALTVSNVAVNEGSPYAVFTVTGATGQTVNLSLAGATGDSPEAAGGAAALGATPALEYLEGGVWKPYDANNPPEIASGATTLLVRVAISAEQEAGVDGPETFRLVATNTGGVESLNTQGIATITDDGSGNYFAATNTTATPALPAGVVLDDDRALTVGDISVNEGSPYAVFTVSGAAGQLTTLTLSNGTTTGLADLQYYNGSAWVPYTGGTVPLDASGKLLVRTALTDEQEAAIDNGETFSLKATNTGGSFDIGTATVQDDGTGTYYPDAAPVSGAPAVSTTALLDDDRALTVSSQTVNEASGPMVFTVSGVDGQKVKLELQSTGSSLGDALVTGTGQDIASTFRYSVDNGANWLTYDPTVAGGYVTLGSYPLKVEVTLTRDALVESSETFQLAATNTGGATAVGIGTITDYVVPVTAVAVAASEAGGLANATAGTDPSGDLVTTAGFKLDSVAIGGSTQIAGGSNVTLDGAFGVLTFKDDGTWSYAVKNTDSDVQALRQTTNTLTDTFTYTVVDAYGAKSTSTLTITVQGANDTPVAAPDYNVAKESLLPGTDATQYTANDPLGYKATGNVLPNDADVDGYGETASLVGLVASATGSTAATTVLTFSTPPANVRVGFYAYLGTTRLEVGGQPVQITSIDGGTIGLSHTVTVANNTVITFWSKADGTGTKGDASLTSSATATGAGKVVTLATPTAGIVAGMSISSGAPAGTTVTSVVYDSTGKATSIIVSQDVTLNATPLTFAGALNTTLTGVYGTLKLDADGKGGYTYTPFANNLDISQGQSVQEVFNYKMQDAGSLTSESTLTITVLGSGTNDPNAVPDVNSITEAVDSIVSTSTASASVLTNDTTPTNPNTVTAIRAADDSAFISVGASTTIQGLYGQLTIGSSGSYTYELYNSNAEVQALNVGETLIEQFQYEVQNGEQLLVNNVAVVPAVYLKDVATLTITINGANDSPTLDLDTATAGNNFEATFTEGGSAVSLINGADLNIGDVDSTTFNKVTLSFEQTGVPNANEELKIGGTTIRLDNITANSTATTFVLGTVTYSYTVAVNAGVVTIEFKDSTGTGTLSSAETEALLDALKYSNTSDNPTNPMDSVNTTEKERVFSLSVTDAGGLTSQPATSTVTVTPVNDPPVLDLDGNDSSLATGADYKGSFTVGGTAAAIADIDLSVTDPDSANIVSATIVLTNAKEGDSLEVIATGWPSSLTAPAKVTASADGTLTLTITGSASKADYATAIEAIRFAATGTDYTDRVIEVTLSDGTSPDPDGTRFSNTATATLAVLPDNRLLTVAGSTVNEASPYVVFTVGGAAGQRVSLELGSTGTASVGVDTANAGTGVPLQYLNASGDWVDYTPGAIVEIPASGPLLVRTAVVSDKLNEGSETLALIARNDAGTPATGSSTIKDDGTGDIFLAANEMATPSLVTDAGYPVLDDDRPLTVSSIEVNEASAFAVFTVGGIEGQRVELALQAGTATTSDYTASMEYWNGTAWAPYAAAVTIPTDTDSTPGEAANLLVRVAITNDGFADNGEVFTLQATNSGGTSAAGTATIKDDGTGTLFTTTAASTTDGVTAATPTGLATPQTLTPATTAVLAPTDVILNDDRALSVGDVIVNEGSDFALFSVEGAEGQYVKLSLTAGSAALADSSPATDGSEDFGPAIEYWDGDSWEAYTANSYVKIPAGSTTLLVRTAIIDDTASEGAQTFTLTATNTGGGFDDGQATIKDDGSGEIFNFSSTTSSTPLLPGATGYPVLDDDRLLAVSNVAVNEGSPYAVFTVTGATGQTVNLSLAGATGDSPEAAGGAAALGATPALEYLEGGVWKTYNSANPPEIASGATTLLVRVAISAEQEAGVDGPETFRLVATNTGGTPSASTQGVATIYDDGSGNYFAATNTTATPALPAGVALDDDRAITISSPMVNEASPYAVFTVSGAAGAAQAGQLVSLALAPTGSTSGHATPSLDYQPLVEYSTNNGASWTVYTGGTVPLDSAGNVLVRVPIENDGTDEPNETFQLSAANTGGTSVVGTATIQDDGNGTIWSFNSSGALTGSNPGPGLGFDDDRPLTVTGSTVNEASDWAVFTVTGAVGQIVTLGTQEGAGSGFADIDQTQKLQFWNAATSLWEDYGTSTVIPDGGTLLVRVNIIAERDALDEPGETFQLVASNTGGTAYPGTSTIVDDGNGVVYPDAAPTNATTPVSTAGPSSALDDDRPLRVDDVTVNEGSPKVVFSVQGAAGQYLKLSLAEGTAKVDADGTPIINGTEDYGPALEVFNGTNWIPYNTANFVQIPSGGTLLVRTTIINDSADEGGHNFTLTATNTGGSGDAGTATIRDDGTGSYWIGNATAPATPAELAAAPTPITLDDDRPILVQGGTYNEGSPRAVFNVTANAGQLLSLAVEDVDTNDLDSAPIYYSIDNGASWTLYTGAAFAAGAGPVLVAVDITTEADGPYEGSEELKLVVNAGKVSEAKGSAFITDDGTGKIAPAIDANSANISNATADLGGVKDDDRAPAVSSPTVNEASPFAVFTVSGGQGQLVSLELKDGSAGAADYGSGLEYSADGGATWLPYTSGTVALNGAGGTLLVRTPVRQDSTFEGVETFTLTARTVGGMPTLGTATIRDDGNGVIFNPDGTENLSALKDDDRVTPAAPEARAPAPVMAEPPAPITYPEVHVQRAVAEARGQGASATLSAATGPASLPSGESSRAQLRALDAAIERFEPATDPNLYVLPAVRDTRGEGAQAQAPSMQMQSGLLWNELAGGLASGALSGSGLFVSLDPLTQTAAQTLADQTLAALLNPDLAPVPEAVAQADAADGEAAEASDERRAAQLAAARAALTGVGEAFPLAHKGMHRFSAQLKQAAARPAWERPAARG